MKKLRGWDSYVAESMSDDERSIELPLTDDEVYIIGYPSRRQGAAMAAAQEQGDVEGLLVALLGQAAGERVAELSADYPGYVLDEFLLDVMRKFGFVDEDTTTVADAATAVASPKAAPTPRTSTKRRSAPRTNSAVGSS